MYNTVYLIVIHLLVYKDFRVRVKIDQAQVILNSNDIYVSHENTRRACS